MEEKTKCYCGHTTTCDCGPEEEPKQETLEEVAKKYFDYNIFCDGITDFEKEISIRSYIAGSKWQQERSYSEEEVYNIIIDLLKRGYVGQIIDYGEIEEWFEQFKNK
jgi:hypothetical protein